MEIFTGIMIFVSVWYAIRKHKEIHNLYTERELKAAKEKESLKAQYKALAGGKEGDEKDAVKQRI